MPARRRNVAILSSIGGLKIINYTNINKTFKITINMTKITITIEGDNVTVNQSDAPTKVEQKNKKFFIIMMYCNFDEQSWVEFVSDDYISAVNKLKCLRSSDNNDYSYRLLIQDENDTIIPCNGTDWDIDK